MSQERNGQENFHCLVDFRAKLMTLRLRKLSCLFLPRGKFSSVETSLNTALLAKMEKELKEILNKVNDQGRHYSMKMSVKKTKAMIITLPKEVLIMSLNTEEKVVEQVHNFMYLR